MQLNCECKRVKELCSIEWMLSNKKTTQQEEYIPRHGDLSDLNKTTTGLILHSVEKEQLRRYCLGVSRFTGDFHRLFMKKTAAMPRNIHLRMVPIDGFGITKTLQHR